MGRIKREALTRTLRCAKEKLVGNCRVTGSSAVLCDDLEGSGGCGEGGLRGRGHMYT